MSEEILEQTAEELEEEQQAVAEESSGEEILDEAKAKVKEEEVDEEEVAEEAEEVEEVEEAISIPKTKAGMIKALYDQLNGMKKADLSDSFSKIMGSTLTEEDEEEGEEEEEEKPMESKKLKKEDLEIDVKEDIEAITNGEDLSEDFKTKASTIFEAAVSAKVLSEVNQRVEKLEEDYKKEITEAKEEHLSTVT